ncbi:MAG: hypothetical protein U0075_05905 [Thermomicrobiales bacterium]
MDDHPALSRRRILQAAVGAVTLTAGGLYLPMEPERAEARDGAYGGELGGNRGQRRRRQRSRHNGDRRGRKPDRGRDEGPLPGKGILKNIQIRVMNLSADPFSLVLISGAVRISSTVRAHDWLTDTDFKDDEGWIWMQTCDCQATGMPMGLAIHLNNPGLGGVWYQVWADMALLQSPDGLYKHPATWAMTEPITIAERQDIVVPFPRSAAGAWDLHLRRFDDSNTFKNFELEFRGSKKA